ncbi:DUF3857 domain-containing protein [Desertivirga arenae]|uniref:DUF3857 domain-containing protein n=1 Tax=Desertivirga arenae TaxID=2810309 RepID=UPI001A9681DA|nr:DUF3857 domain-containing protein [Pedobacter sp. SYSU D00823]
MKKTLILGLLALSCFHLKAQEDFQFGKPTSTEFELKKYGQDTSANAVVLREFGTAYISSSNSNLIFNYHVRLKIFNSKAFDKGQIAVMIRNQGGDAFETMRDIKGVTFYPDENGLMRQSDLDPKQIFKQTKATKFSDQVKFALPNIRPGSIIEYSYQIESPFIHNFRTWEFQEDIPKIYSEFSPRIPGNYNYNVSLRGPFKLSKNKGEVEKECYSPGGGFKVDCSKMIYAMENIPAFKEEAYMTAASNFKAAMYYELSDYTDFHGVKTNYTKEWKDIDHELKTHEWFGLQLKKKDFFKDRLPATTLTASDPLEKAKGIYHFMQTWFRWNGIRGKYTDEGLKKAFEGHAGNVGDINLSLVAAMNSAGLDAEAVMLSTRDNGLINNLFPVVSDFDYVVCKVNIGDTYYLLDATDQLLPFGLLPLRCINDRGRVMSLNKASYWIDLKASQKQSKTVSLKLDINENGKAAGTFSVYSAGYEAYDKRRMIKKYNSIDDYVENLDESLQKIKILKHDIQNLDTVDQSLSEKYEIEIDIADKVSKDRLILNPYFLERLSENPLKLEERNYPIDLGAASETRIIVEINYPANFEITNKPSNIGLALPNSGGKFISNTAVEANTLTFMNHKLLTKAIYSPEEYPYLKELYNKIIQSQQVDLIFKKK